MTLPPTRKSFQGGRMYVHISTRFSEADISLRLIRWLVVIDTFPPIKFFDQVSTKFETTAKASIRVSDVMGPNYRGIRVSQI